MANGMLLSPLLHQGAQAGFGTGVPCPLVVWWGCCLPSRSPPEQYVEHAQCDVAETLGSIAQVKPR